MPSTSEQRQLPRRVSANSTSATSFDTLPSALSSPDGLPNGGLATSNLARVVRVFGTQGNDTLIGTAANNTILGYGGNDTLIGGGGNDVLRASTGNDTIIISDLKFRTIRGGTGTDTLRLDGSGLNLNLRTLASNQIIGGIEKIDLTGTGNNRLTLNASDVLALSTTTNQLTVNGNLGDVVIAIGTWTFDSTTTLNGIEYNQYSQGDATLLVDANVAFNPPLNLSDLDLSELDGGNGFVINGVNANDFLGSPISNAGDINGDGFDDLIFGDWNAQPNGQRNTGATYVVFGSAGSFGASLNLSALDGSNGFVINGLQAHDSLGYSVSDAGDINGDGIDDLIIGADNASSNGQWDAGASYVVFGSASGFDATLDLSTLDGSNGFVINGIKEDDDSGNSVSSAGDINGDGIDDLMIAAPQFSYDIYYGGPGSGESYVVFGSASGFGASLNLSTLDGSNGFIIDNVTAYDTSSISLSCAGDVNGDGFDDLIIGVDQADPNGLKSAGASYVVFGSVGGFGAKLQLFSYDYTSISLVCSLDGSNGFAINGINANDFLGESVSSAGDVNGDGIDDLIIGAFGADPNGLDKAGASYVVFGSDAGFDATLDLSTLDGSNGFIINGINANDGLGGSVSSAGDVNGDGIDDLIIGAFGADPNGLNSAGASYVVFGSDAGFDATLDLSTLDGSNGFIINGINANEGLGGSVSSAGDVNGDGIDDLIIGGTGPGSSYVLFGGDFTQQVSAPGTEGDDILSGTTDGDILIGGLGNDILIGSGGLDVLTGAAGDDTLAVSDLNFRRVSGGSGTDTLSLDSFGINLDLSAISNNKITSIEQIDLTGIGDNSLTLNRQTSNLRQWLGLEKQKTRKGDAIPATHAVDGVTLASTQFVRYRQLKGKQGWWEGSVDITPAPFAIIRRPPICRRQLHLMIPAQGGIRRKYGGTTTRHGFRKGDYVKAQMAGRVVYGWVSGDTERQVSVSDINWKRLGQFSAKKTCLVKRSTGLLVSPSKGLSNLATSSGKI